MNDPTKGNDMREHLYNFKVECEVDKGNGTESHILYIKATTDDEARLDVKAYCIEKGWIYYGESKPILL